MHWNIQSLPNEILIQILTPLPTRALLPLAPTSAQFSSVILSILRYRLLLATSLPSYKLILKAYHPTRKYSEDYLFCTYLGTPGLSPTHQSEGFSCEKITEGDKYAKVSQLYSRFQPERPSVARRPSRGGVNASQIASSGSSVSQPVSANDVDGEDEKVEHVINLDSHELFSQFCAIANLVKVGPRRGLFLYVANVEDKIMRIWREWLKARARDSREEEQLLKRTKKVKSKIDRQQQRDQSTGNSSNLSDEPPTDNGNEDPDAAIAGRHLDPCSPSSPILWTDQNHNVGLRVTIKDRKWRAGRDGAAAGPILISADEEEPVTYSLEINELLVRTTHLMLLVEESVNQDANISGKAMIFGSVVTAASTASTSSSPSPATTPGAMA